MARPLADIGSFGDIAAENNFRPEFFVTSASWHRFRQGLRPVVVGRKGTGKTALRLALLEEARRNPLLFASDLSFRDYPWNAHNSVSDSQVGHRSRYVETWLFLMHVELSKLAAGENQANLLGADGRDAASSLRRFVEDNWGRLR